MHQLQHNRETPQQKEKRLYDLTIAVIGQLQELGEKYQQEPKGKFGQAIGLYTQVYDILQAPVAVRGTEPTCAHRLYELFAKLLNEFLNKDQEGNYDNVVRFTQIQQSYFKFSKFLYARFKYLDECGMNDKQYLKLQPFSINILHEKAFKKHKEVLQKDALNVLTIILKGNVTPVESEAVKLFCQLLQEFDANLIGRLDSDYKSLCAQFTQEAVKIAQGIYQGILVELQRLEGYKMLQMLDDYLTSQTEFITGSLKSIPDLMKNLSTQHNILLIVPSKVLLLHLTKSQNLLSLLQLQCKDGQRSLPVEQQDLLRKVHRIFKRLDDNFKEIKEQIQKYIQKEGNEIIAQKRLQLESMSLNQIQVELQDSFINEITDLELVAKSSILVSFQNDEYIQLAINDAFVNIVNEQISSQVTIPAYLAAYCANTLKQQSLQDSDFVRIQILYKYLLDKDYFIQHHRQQLAQRLILKTANYQYEKLLIKKLMDISGDEYLQHLMTMINDIEPTSIENEMCRSFIERLDNYKVSQLATIELKILKKDAWPPFETTYLIQQEEHPCPILQQFKATQILLENFYNEKLSYIQRKLEWSHCISTVIIKFKRFDIQMSIDQANLLFVFNRNNVAYTLEELKRFTLQDTKYLKKNIASLAQVNLIIVKNNTFLFNDAFNSKKLRIDVKLVIPFIELKNQLESDTYLLEDRNLMVDSSITKILKERKTIEFSELSNLLLLKIKLFTPSTTQIKERVERLLQRDYIKRDQTSFDVLHYSQ